ncbi:MAG: hypothetical protein R2698_07550 [Microthrixaceae bacterium]
MGSTSLHFADSVRAVSRAARGFGLMVPVIRTASAVGGPRGADPADRTIRRVEGHVPVIAIRVAGRPSAAVQSDLIDGFLVANTPTHGAPGPPMSRADEQRFRRVCWAALERDGLLVARVTDHLPVGRRDPAASPRALAA